MQEMRDFLKNRAVELLALAAYALLALVKLLSGPWGVFDRLWRLAHR